MNISNTTINLVVLSANSLAVVVLIGIIYALVRKWRRNKQQSVLLAHEAAHNGFSPNSEQWQRNIVQSGLLNNLYGNWQHVSGRLVSSTPSILQHFTGKQSTIHEHALLRNGYEIELLEFLIQTQTKQQQTTIGPFVGIHINLRNNYHEVDILYKSAFHWLQKLLHTAQRPPTWTTESTDFNKRFSIVSNNHQTNLRVLSPDIMALMLDSNIHLMIEIIGNHLLLYVHKHHLQTGDIAKLLTIGNAIVENLE